MPGWFCAPSTTTFVPLIHDAARRAGSTRRRRPPPPGRAARAGTRRAPTARTPRRRRDDGGPATAGEQDRARAERVDADAVGAELARERHGEVDLGRLRRGVLRAGLRSRAGDRGMKTIAPPPAARMRGRAAPAAGGGGGAGTGWGRRVARRPPAPGPAGRPPPAEPPAFATSRSSPP